MASERASQRAFFGVAALLLAASAAVTIVSCASMSAMGEMPTPRGRTMSMAWMRLPGQTWPGAAASSLGMWVAIMLPSLVPMLWRYRQVRRAGGPPQGLRWPARARGGRARPRPRRGHGPIRTAGAGTTRRSSRWQQMPAAPGLEGRARVLKPYH